MQTLRLLTPERWQTLAGLLDQATVAAANLAVGLLVLHISTKEEYGTYSLCYMTLILLTGVSGSLFGAQMTVSFYQIAPQGRTAYAASMLTGQAALSLVACLAVLLAAATGSAAEGVRDLLVTMALAIPFAMLHDFFRTYLFMVGRAGSALLLDALLLAGWSAATVLLWTEAALPPHLAALAGYGVATASTSAAAFMVARLPRRPDLRHSLRSTKAAWQHGRWALGDVVVTAAQNQGHVYLLGWLATASAVADLNAARMLLTPISLLSQGGIRTLVPRLAQLWAVGDAAAMRALTLRAMLALLGVSACYAVALLLGYDLILRKLLTANYAGIGPLVLLWVVVTALQVVDIVLSSGLQVCKRFRYLTIINVWTAIPVLAALIPMILWFGAVGSLIVLACGFAGMALLLWRDYRSQGGAALGWGR